MEDEQFVIFDLGCEQYGVEISQVREIIRPKDMTRIPNAPDYVEGVINLRGQVTTVINLGRRLGFSDEGRDEKEGKRIIVIEYEGSPIGMLVDNVRDVKRLSSDDMEELPPLISKNLKGEFLRSVGKIGEELILIVDLNKILSKEEVEGISG
ncbi:MAG: purine-binding chemotaxis protein [Candidatus Methanolliviera sp. GoM_oil]|nr:MAG: purine-binding chemotaxis protein [Candidatus Methanolliviera sp. GoM_oil]